MNSNRLSTSGKSIEDRYLLLADITKLLNLTSNYETREDGRVWIISENKYQAKKSGAGGKKKCVQLISLDGSVFKTFNSLTDCGKFLGVSRKTVSNKMEKSQSVLFEGKSYTLRTIDYELCDEPEKI
uniref:Nuclease-associated modular DNA-binding 1 domain-containing protein n=1 Tax=Dactylella tenuis TaxID=383872 RepID=A0A4Y5MZM4_9PEZI|nr:hypothetical protein [Dactylella tenuis]QCW06846.1 hypothetical protein [Dactylella tenuis]